MRKIRSSFYKKSVFLMTIFTFFMGKCLTALKNKRCESMLLYKTYIIFNSAALWEKNEFEKKVTF